MYIYKILGAIPNEQVGFGEAVLLGKVNSELLEIQLPPKLSGAEVHVLAVDEGVVVFLGNRALIIALGEQE